MGELKIPGNSKKEILLSTNICHPSMGNNETSGIVVTLAIAMYLQSLKKLFLQNFISSRDYWINFLHFKKSESQLKKMLLGA